MGELRELFFETAAELVEKLNEEALRLEKTPDDPETARSLRRIVHTLKGDAAACGYRELSELAHQFEDVLALKTNAAVIPEVALRAADVFGALIHAYHAKKKLPDLQPLHAEIARLAHPDADVSDSKQSEPGVKAEKVSREKVKAEKVDREKVKTEKVSTERVDAEKAPQSKDVAPWSEYERLAIAHAAEDGKRLHHVIVQVDPQCGMPIAARQMIHIALASLGEVLALYPADGDSAKIDRIQAAITSDKSVDEIRAKCSIPTISQHVEITPLRLPAPAAEPEPAEAATSGKAESLAPEHSDSDADEPSIAEPATPAATSSDNILRVDAERIDSVLNLVGELILAKSMLQQTLVEFERQPARKIQRRHGFPGPHSRRPATLRDEDPHGSG
jgi:two-component system chemotaxis sensor kinase CheA